MAAEFSDREKALIDMLRTTTVALGCALIEKSGEQDAAAIFAELMERRVTGMKAKGELGDGFKVLADMVSKTAPVFGQEVSFDVENMICRVKKCGLWETGRTLGYEKTPLCVRCKANSDTVLAYVLPGYKKRILKSLWRGDEECYMIYEKQEG